MNTTKYCLIGDLHGRVDALDRIIAKSPGYHYVFLGDTIHHKPFFKKAKKSSPIRMINRIRRLVEKGEASFIIGNNENYVLKNFMLPEQEVTQKEVRYTLSCLRELSINQRLEVLHFLANSPLTLEFESYGKIYRCAHGYYNPNHQTTEDRDKVLTGIGYPWFKNDNLEDHIKPDALYFFGHYGYPYIRKNLHIIDATNFEGVGVYYTDREEFLIYY